MAQYYHFGAYSYSSTTIFLVKDWPFPFNTFLVFLLNRTHPLPTSPSLVKIPPSIQYSSNSCSAYFPLPPVVLSLFNMASEFIFLLFLFVKSNSCASTGAPYRSYFQTIRSLSHFSTLSAPDFCVLNYCVSVAGRPSIHSIIMIQSGNTTCMIIYR